MLDGVPTALPDSDPAETEEWLASLDGLIERSGPERARFVLRRLLEGASRRRVGLPGLTTTDFINTIPAAATPVYPGDVELERGFRRLLRWNAAIMVHRAQRPGLGLGGHIASFASAATLYEVGFNHFFRGKDHPGGGDQIFFQGHCSPGVYARAFLEGRLGAEDLDGFRQEKSHTVGGRLRGLPSYPHPRPAPAFWEFPTVSMGLGPLNAIYQASFNRYLAHRGLKDTSDQRVWAFVGDGEMDEPEARGLIHFAADEGLDNLVFVVNCNLQRLDGPVRGNGKIIQELEGLFRGAGWNVVKVVWGSGWDRLIEADTSGALVDLFNTVPDGDFQTFKGKDGAYVRQRFFGRDSRTAELVKHMSDDEIWRLARGGHDFRKVYAAYRQATQTVGAPTVVLAHTIKGYFLGSHFTARNASHQMKKLKLEDLKDFRDRLELPITDAVLEADPDQPPFYHPGADDPRVVYALERRRALGGPLPQRRNRPARLKLPSARAYQAARSGSGAQPVSTTMAWVRLLKEMMREKEFGPHVVPIIPDEARTFGLDSFFPTIKIYNPHGQRYTPVDHELMLAYRESSAGQIIHTGIDEAGAVGAFTAAGTSYATHGLPMVPIYVFYSMFGFQRTGDGFWAAADQLARGFLIGATAGKTTLAGEGLQHMDGHSPLLASTNPAVRHYDLAYAYEIAHVMEHGLETMYGPCPQDVIFYLTVYNEPIVQPKEPDDVDVEGIRRGLYLLRPGDPDGLSPQAPRVQLLASGIALPWALEAQELLRRDAAVVADVWSVTSWNELRRDAVEADGAVMNGQLARPPYVARCLKDRPGPVLAVSDFMRAVPDQIAPWVPGDFSSLGGDGFGFSDTRAAARRWLKVDGPSIVVKVLHLLARRGEVDPGVPAQAFAHYRLDSTPVGDRGRAGEDS
ncbi:MAG: pyruvate dehydrogenase (acetyl-transferring), homodimeric type [Propionibacteriaceae bacterium]|jgi:pyruvate dehydrogenase E1 component|nr:pyruvate dehydrogenase (acetyl-transferring), homodimeric type [Propionibacteriaceae bacterium]